MNQPKLHTPTTDKSTGLRKEVKKMTVKNRSIPKLITCFLLAMMVLISTAIPAFAYSQGDPNHPAEAAITKRLKMPINTDVPEDAKFTFEFTTIGKEGSSVTTGIPDIPSVTVDLTSDAWTYTDKDDSSIYYAVKETPNFVASVANSFTSTGVYKYKVKEVISPAPINITDGTKEGATYSNAVYDIELWVFEDENKPGSFYVKFVNAKISTDKDLIDEFYPEEDGGEKVEPKPGGEDKEQGETIEDDFSQLIYTNSYWKSNGSGTTDPNKGALEVIKEVKAAIDGAPVNSTDRFAFDVTVVKPAMLTANQEYTVCVVKDGQIVTSSEHYAGTIDAGGFFKVVSDANGAKFTVNLAHGERLVFVDLHVGSKVEVEETVGANYKAQYQRSFSGDNTYPAPSKDGKWGFPRTGDDPGPHYTEDGTDPNKATFTNFHLDVTPTGINVDDLPFVILIVLAITGLLGFVVIKTRRNKKYDD